MQKKLCPCHPQPRTAHRNKNSKVTKHLKIKNLVVDMFGVKYK